MSNSSLVNRFSYSGVDAKAYAYYLKNKKQVQLESLHTISFSIYEAKGRVRSLGFKSVRGFTRAVREISGTLIMTVVEDHPLAPLMMIDPNNKSSLYGGFENSWSLDAYNTARGAAGNPSPFGEGFDVPGHVRIPTTISPFNLRLVYNTETPSSTTNQVQSAHIGFNAVDQSNSTGQATRLGNLSVTQKSQLTYKDGAAFVELVDVEILGQGMVTSVNDMVTEVQYQFLARDLKEFNYIPDIFIEKQYELATSNRALTNQEFENFKAKLASQLGDDVTVVTTNSGEILLVSTTDENISMADLDRLNNINVNSIDPAGQDSPVEKDVITENQNKDELPLADREEQKETGNPTDTPAETLSEQDEIDVGNLQTYFASGISASDLEDWIVGIENQTPAQVTSMLPGIPEPEGGFNNTTVVPSGNSKVLESPNSGRYIYSGTVTVFHKGVEVARKDYSFTQ